MISLFKSLDNEKTNHRSDEGPETRHQDKGQLYDTLAMRFYLPPLNSRGITREYLLAVHRAEVYRLPMTTLKHFEVDLTTKMVTKVGLINNGLVVRKLNILLQSKREPDLGFSEFDPPDQVDCSHIGLAAQGCSLRRPDQHHGALRGASH